MRVVVYSPLRRLAVLASLAVLLYLGAAIFLHNPRAEAAANQGSQVVASNVFTLNSSTATSIVPQDRDRHSVCILNTHATLTLYLGASNVTSATGFPVAPGLAFTSESTAAIYGISASGAPTGAWFADK